MLCLAPFVGMKIGNSNPPMYVDRHGDNLARVETEGGYFRLAHDAWLSTVFADCAYHGLRVSREVRVSGASFGVGTSTLLSTTGTDPIGVAAGPLSGIAASGVK